MVEETKEALDVVAVSTGILSLAAWLPPIASIIYNHLDGLAYMGVRHSYGTQG